jgi:tRNA/tmRNA/rRNA uracil-C5-methylase (TrmA/RlmC/RlmD family)
MGYGADKSAELNRITNAVILRAATADAASVLLDGRAIAGGAWTLAEPEAQPEPELRTMGGSTGGGNGSDVLLVDPPRAGLDAPTLQICRRFDHILYISCNPNALHQNLHGATCEQVRTAPNVSRGCFPCFKLPSHED